MIMNLSSVCGVCMSIMCVSPKSVCRKDLGYKSIENNTNNSKPQKLPNLYSIVYYYSIIYYYFYYFIFFNKIIGNNTNNRK